MKHSEMHNLMNVMLEKIIAIRDEGQKEYAHDDNDVFANFNRVGNLLEEDRKKVLMTYMLKHVDGIAAFVKGHKSQREDVRGRITDCIVYLMLLWGMIDEEENDSTINKQSSDTMRNVLEEVRKNDILPVDRRRIKASGIQPNGNMQNVRKKRSRLQESKEVGTT